MKVRLPKSWDQLSKRDKEIIEKVKTEEVIREVNHEEAELQKVWLQMACIVLNRCFGFGEKRLLLFLGTWREIYRFVGRLKTKADRDDYLKQEMSRIFRRGGYPYKYIDKLEDVA